MTDPRIRAQQSDYNKKCYIDSPCETKENISNIKNVLGEESFMGLEKNGEEKIPKGIEILGWNKIT